jgi:hypothetical protein
MVTALAFGGTAVLIHARTSKVGAKWGAFLFALIGGIILAAHPVADTARGFLADAHPLVPQVIASIAVAVLLVDVFADMKPDPPAAVAAFIFPTLYVDAQAVVQGAGLPTAIGLGLIAAFIQAKVGEAADAGKAKGKTGRRKGMLWLSLACALVGGIAFALTSYAGTVNGWLSSIHGDIPGAVGLIALAAVIIDAGVDGKPDRFAMVGAYVTPAFFLPAIALIRDGFSAIGG